MSIPGASGPGHEMSLLEHLEELRARLVRCILAAAVGFAVCFAFAERILEILLHPLKQVLPPKSELITTGLTEGFFISMKAAFVAGLFLVSPIIFHQIWRFISPGLYENERRMAIPVAFFTALCFVSGACFGYFVVFPFGFTFLANYAADVVTLMPKLSEYYSFSLGLLFAFGIIFEMPVFIFFLAAFGIVDHVWLRQKRRWAIVVFFIVAAILTPTPDAVNQILMAAPMVVLYEVSIWVAYFFGRKKRQPEEEQAAVEGAEKKDELASGEAAPAALDSALEEAHVSENHQPGETAASGDAATQADGDKPGTADAATGGEATGVDKHADAHAAEREAHDTAALGHDNPAPAAAPQPGDAGSAEQAPADAAPAEQAQGDAAPAEQAQADAGSAAQAADPAATPKPGGENKTG